MSLKRMKNFIQISLFIMDCIYFICHIFYLKTSSKITQFNSTSTFFLDIYIIILLLLCALNSFNSTLFSSLISSNIRMLVSIKGKAIFLILISLIYIGCDSMSQMAVGILFLISAIIILTLEKLCNCDSEELKPKDEPNLQHVTTSSSIDETKEKESKKEDKDNPYNITEDF